MRVPNGSPGDRPTRSWTTSGGPSRGLFSFSYQPLETISSLAFPVTPATGVGIAFYIAFYFIVPSASRGFPTLLVAVLFLGSVQLFCLSILAEYMGRIFEEVERRPAFIVRSIMNDLKERAEAVSARSASEGSSGSTDAAR